MTRRLVLLALLIYGLLFAGLASLHGRLVALAVPLVVYLCAVLIFSPERPKLSSTRSLSSDIIRPGSRAEVTVTITNQGADLEEVRLEDVVPARLEVVSGDSSLLTSLPAGESVTLRYAVSGKRGSYSFLESNAAAIDHLGLFQRRAVVKAPQTLAILPEIHKLRPIPIRPLRTNDYNGSIPVRHGGAGISFFVTRDYQPGDPQRWINWRASARQKDHLIVNQYQQERIADVGIILDSRALNDITRPNPDGSPGPSLFEYSIQAAAALTGAFLQDGNRVGLLVYGYAMERVFPGYGKTQRERILRALARARTGNNFALDSLDYLPTRFFPTRSQMVIISPLDINDLPVLVRLRALGYQVMVISPDPVAFEAPAYAGRPDMELPVRIAQVERRLLMKRLNQVGIQAVDWNVDEPFERVARRALSRPARPARILRMP